MTQPAPSPTPTPTPSPSPAPAPAPTPAPAVPAPEFSAEVQAQIDRIVGQRLNSERAKYGGKTGDEIAAAFEKAGKFDAAELEKGSDLQRAAAEAKAVAEQAADARYRPMLAKAALQRAAVGRVTDENLANALAPLGDMSYFLTDSGDVDNEKVAAYIDGIAPKAATSPAPVPRGPVIPGHQAPSEPGKNGDNARAWLARKGIKVPTS